MRRSHTSPFADSFCVIPLLNFDAGEAQSTALHPACRRVLFVTGPIAPVLPEQLTPLGLSMDTAGRTGHWCRTFAGMSG